MNDVYLITFASNGHCGAPKPQRRAQRRPRGKLGYKLLYFAAQCYIRITLELFELLFVICY